ncbi:hypothetical protein N657DRAFT_560783 [Parathielavia appendiculata]|uniref:Uncharacterized protein n=1 Tax=Parathielavia appendiculata TaxID=2587402 RepID=A0AAN6Z8K6_9PEZI|nr:hypothetical protein N657DRAFT_560783 [Parathielavia appendiculata]
MDGLGIDHRYHHQHQHQHFGHAPFAPQQLPSQPTRKRKAEVPPENNERLSKRMSLLNLEHSGQKLYVPVESPDAHYVDASAATKSQKTRRHKQPIDDSQMQLDDSKYKVYIYNIDDELSSSDNESESADGKLVFLPDIEKHLLASRIPTRVLDPRPDPCAELAGKELVLYSVPSSISIPEEQDSVRKAIIEARARAREKQRAGMLQAAARQALVPVPAMSSSPLLTVGPMEAEPLVGFEEDPDAMELD